MEVIRPATINEKRFFVSDGLGFSHSIILIARYAAPSKLSSSESIDSAIHNAVNYCIDTHPVLRVTIKDPGGDKPQLALLQTLNLSDHVTHVETPPTGETEQDKIRNWHNHLHTLRLPPAGERPQWRVFISHASPSSFYLAFMHSHALWDGLGSITFHETFLKGLNSDAAHLAQTSAHRRGASSLAPPIETAGKLTISWSYLLPILVQELLPKWLASLLGMQDEDMSGIWTGTEARPSSEPRPNDPPTGLAMVLIPKETLTRGIQVCRTHGARLTSLLNYLAARGLCRSLRSRGGRYDRVKVANAIDLRRALGKGQSELANYVSFITETFKISETQPQEDSKAGEAIKDEDWAFMKHNTENLASFSGTLADHPVALLKYISDLKGWLQSRARNPPNVSFGLSNLGIFNGGDEADGDDVWRGEDAVISQSGNRTGAPFDMQLLSTKGGSMGISATWWPGMLGVEDEEAFVQEVLDQVRDGMERV